MGMSSYIMDIEETFFDQCADIIKECEVVYEAIDRCVELGKPVVPHMSADDISDAIGEMWNEYWSNYQ